MRTLTLFYSIYPSFLAFPFSRTGGGATGCSISHMLRKDVVLLHLILVQHSDLTILRITQFIYQMLSNCCFLRKPWQFVSITRSDIEENRPPDQPRDLSNLAKPGKNKQPCQVFVPSLQEQLKLFQPCSIVGPPFTGPGKLA